jgi:hypothetical protein
MREVTFFDNSEDETSLYKTSITIGWSRKGVGFGQFRFYEKDGVTHIENECMGREFIKSILTTMVDNAVLDDETAAKQND